MRRAWPLRGVGRALLASLGGVLVVACGARTEPVSDRLPPDVGVGRPEVPGAPSDGIGDDTPDHGNGPGPPPLPQTSPGAPTGVCPTTSLVGRGLECAPDRAGLTCLSSIGACLETELEVLCTCDPRTLFWQCPPCAHGG
jgi:hypothetical protein